jgi:DNA polymerase-3 subunit alpha
MEKIKKEYSEFPEESREKHKDVFYYFDGFKGVIIQKGIHAAGVCASTLDLREEMGIFWDQKAKCNVSMCDMKEIDSLNFVKYDLLGLKTLDVIKDTYKLMGEKTKKTHQIDWNDKRVFDEIQKHQLGLFQFESNFAYSLLKEFKPESIEDIAIVSGVIRPSADSFREKLINKEFNKNPSAQIDELLGETYGYLLYQEDIISFLNKICGLTPSEADLVRRFIGKKQADKLTEYLPRIEKGFVDNGGTSEEFKQFMKVLDDASGYSFSKNHSIPYSELTYETAKLRMENNIYFVTAYLNNASNDDDIAMATQYMKDNKLILMPITFGKSIDKYSTDGTCIYKGLESIKFLNKIIPFELNDMNNIDNFVDLLEKITFDSSVNTKQLDILIKLDYFLEFGKMGKLLKFNELYHKMLLSDKKGYKKNMSIDDVDPDIYPYIRNCTKTPKRYVIETPSKILLNIWKSIPDKDEEIINKIKYELKFLGYIKTEIPKGIKIGKVLYNKKNKTGACLKSLRNGNEEWFDLDKDVKLPNKEDVLHIIDMFKTESKSKYRKGNYVLKAYDILKEG